MGTRTTWRGLALALCLLLPLLASCSSDDGDAEVRSSDGADVVAQLPDRAAEFVNAVFRVETEGCGWIGSGSGFAIDAHHVVTNHHVVANDSSPVVRTQSGEALPGRVIGSTERPDLAVIELDDDLPTTVAWADTGALQRDEALVVMGFPVPDRTFKVSTGQVVAFQPPNTREALIANNPIDRGNSGGPALRRDGTVAGVVTEMATRDDDGQRVAIVFTSNSVRRVAQRFIDAPSEVLSSCGLGPDYVPEVPTDFDLPPVADIPAPPVQPQPADLPDVFVPPSIDQVPTVPPTQATTPTTSTPSCVAAPVAIRADQVSVDPVPETTDRWRIRATGAYANDAPTPIEVDRIDLALEGAPTLTAAGTSSGNPLRGGGASAWSADQTITSTTRPVLDSVTLHWHYTDAAYRSCATPAAVWEIPVTAQELEPATPIS
jgi:hypothetical protein